MVKSLVSILFISMAVSLSVSGQNGSIRFKHLNRDNGLSSNRVNCIVEDSQGFMWFGTEDGLNKFDGYDFQVFRNNQNQESGIPSNSIDVILEDTIKNNLWLGSRKGLVYFDQIHQQFYVVANEVFKEASTGNINITSLCFDDQGYLWVGTYNGLYRANRKDFSIGGGEAIKIKKVKQGRTYKVYMDKNHDIWVGQRDGLFRFNWADNSFTRYFNELDAVYSILQDSRGDYWIGSDKSGLYFIKGHPDKGVTQVFNEEKGHFIINRVHKIIEDSPGNYYILIRDGGLYYYNQAKNMFSFLKHDIYDENSINSTALISGTKSSNGIVWLGTYNSGINYIDKATKRFQHYKVNFKPSGIFNNNIRALLEDSEGNIWIGTKEGGGLSKFIRSRNTFVNYPKTNAPGGLHDDYIFALCELNNNELLVGTFRSGMARFNKKTERFKYYTHQEDDPNSLSDNRVYSIFKDKQGIIWVGNYNELQQFNPVTEKFKQINGVERPRCFCDEDEDRVWIGTKEHGLYIYNKISGKYINYLHQPENSKSISSNDIYAIKKDGHGHLWIATRQGINRYNPQTNDFTKFTEADGLPANWICGLLMENDSSIWVSTSNGISNFDLSQNHFHNYDIKDGLQGNEFEGYVALKTRSGHMLFGGRNGFNMFLPREIISNTQKPDLVITGFKLFNKELQVGPDSPLKKHISFTNSMVLKHNQSAITINYVALNYTSPEKNQYAYKLEGFDEDWIYAGTNRSAVYTNIPPGEYTFRVKGSNNDNYWNNEGVSLNITILNPYWKTVWAYMVYVLLLAILLYFVRKILVYRIQQQNLLKVERMEKARIQEINKYKLRFFTNISHEFRTPLTLIAGPLNKLMSYNDDNDEKKYLYQVMHKNVERLLSLVSELMDFRKAEHGKLKLQLAKKDIVSFIQQLVDCFEETARQKQISFQFNYDVSDNHKILFDRNIIDKVLINLLSNAFKYTPENGSIEVKLEVSEEKARVLVIDTGKGIPDKDMNHIFDRFYQAENHEDIHMKGTGIGLAFSKRLMEVHHGDIFVESKPGQGTTFIINFPVHPESYSKEDFVKEQPDVLSSSENEIMPAQVSRTEKDTSTKSKKERLLIVEDNRELSSFLKDHLTNYDILLAEDGKSGYKMAMDKIPDLIISDVMMPEMDGLEMCQKLKSHFATSHIPIILLTAKAQIQQKIEGIEKGAEAYIEKPFDMAYLETVVKNQLFQRTMLRKKYSEQYDAEAQDIALNVHDQKFMDKTHKIMVKNLDNPDFTVEVLGFELGLSRSQLFRKFKTIYGLKPSEFIRNERLKQAKKLLNQQEYNVNEVADRVGFKSASYFITSFKKYYGKTPAEFLSNH